MTSDTFSPKMIRPGSFKRGRCDVPAVKSLAEPPFEVWYGSKAVHRAHSDSGPRRANSGNQPMALDIDSDLEETFV